MCTAKEALLRRRRREMFLSSVLIGILFSIPLFLFFENFQKTKNLLLCFGGGMLLLFLVTEAGFVFVKSFFFWKLKEKEKISYKYFFVIEWTLCISLILLRVFS